MKQRERKQEWVVHLISRDSFTKEINFQALLAAMVIGGLITVVTILIFFDQLMLGLMLAVTIATGSYLLIEYREKVLPQILIILVTIGLIPFLQVSAFLVGIFLLVLLISINLRNAQRSR